MNEIDNRVIVVIPTYNERKTLPGLLGYLFDTVAECDVLVVDDASPDGTGEWASEYAQRQSRLHVLHRPAKSGLASAYIDGFRWCLDRGYTHLVEMDADGSHRVTDLRAMIDRACQLDGPDLVIGSRWIPGGKTQGWAPHRIALSKLGNLYIRLMLNLKVADATAGFRVYRADFVRRMPLDDIQSAGYGFQVEMTRMVASLNGKIVEVPIVFLERRAGDSKMSGAIIIEELVHVTRWGIERVLRR
ncbi:MAG: polyprenol monophosphomannose synthase [Actinomycetaceae bacterium]|nr:polyprenol monophosphomannose synthase [Actinomycetaceae bacterium]